VVYTSNLGLLRVRIIGVQTAKLDKEWRKEETMKGGDIMMEAVRLAGDGTGSESCPLGILCVWDAETLSSTIREL